MHLSKREHTRCSQLFSPRYSLDQELLRCTLSFMSRTKHAKSQKDIEVRPDMWNSRKMSKWDLSTCPQLFISQKECDMRERYHSKSWPHVHSFGSQEYRVRYLYEKSMAKTCARESLKSFKISLGERTFWTLWGSTRLIFPHPSPRWLTAQIGFKRDVDRTHTVHWVHHNSCKLAPHWVYSNHAYDDRQHEKMSQNAFS